ncbi:uncharacterized protein [Cicer arietinum]|uniref:uncharacterized protein n=1 Tax=Cicer arietinum TaxID=3827 RepID=UPI003CC6ADF4
MTNNAANYKVVGAMLMLKKKRLYWTPCAAHCIDLMLGDFEKKVTIDHETISKVDSNDKPTIRFIYEAMDQAKERIQAVFNGVQRSLYVDERWDKQLHRPLHATDYYLNPQLHYNHGFKVDYEVKYFKTQAKFYGSPIAKAALKTKTSSQWWKSCGDEHPELQSFPIRALSLTCNSPGCERNYSAFEMVHTKRRNRFKQKTMGDVVFVMANSKLAKNKQTKNVVEHNLDDLESDDEWIVDNSEDSTENDILDFTIENEDLEFDNQNKGGNGVEDVVPQDDLEIHNLDNR